MRCCAKLVGMDQALKPTKKNGFSVIDVTPDKMTFTMGFAIACCSKQPAHRRGQARGVCKGWVAQLAEQWTEKPAFAPVAYSLSRTVANMSEPL
jgi:hypothetical protein